MSLNAKLIPASVSPDGPAPAARTKAGHPSGLLTAGIKPALNITGTNSSGPTFVREQPLGRLTHPERRGLRTLRHRAWHRHLQRHRDAGRHAADDAPYVD